MSKKRKLYAVLMRGAMYLCTGLTAALLLFLFFYVMMQGLANITWEFLSTKPRYLPTERIGILPDILNTVYIVLATLLTILGGLIPARSAAKCDPVAALRSE